MNRFHSKSSVRFWGMLLGLVAVLAFIGVSNVGAGEILVYTALEDDELAIYKKDLEATHPEINEDRTRLHRHHHRQTAGRKGQPQADVIWGVSATSLLVCDNVGMLTGYNPKGIEKFKPGFLRQEKQGSPLGRHQGLHDRHRGQHHRNEKGLNMPQSYADLLDPMYKGYLVMPNPASSGTGFLTVSAILQIMGEEEGWAYLDKLHQNIAVYTHSGSKPAKMAGKGEYPIGISFAYRGFKQKPRASRSWLLSPRKNPDGSLRPTP